MENSNNNSNENGRFNPCALAMSLGILWGVSLFLVGLIAGFFDWGSVFIEVISSVYVGYDSGVIGSLIGFVWGFIDGVIGGLIFAYLYNLCLGCSKCCKCFCKCSNS